jgi:sugar phosphate isomerase/epimerase
MTPCPNKKSAIRNPKPAITMNRRQFLQSTATLTTLAAVNSLAIPTNVPPQAWPVGCFNRAWTKFGDIDVALDGIKEAGYKIMGLLTRSKTDPFIGADATPEYLADLKKKIASRGLRANLGAIRTLANRPLEEGIADLRKQIDNAHTLNLEWLMSFGVDRPADKENYFKIMSDAAAYAKERNLKLVLKPHGGSSGASEEILESIKAINHPNFSIWYDAGNIIYYTGKDPVAELDPIAKYVTGFCAKDCAQPKGEVMIQLGAGKVDFAAVFKKLKEAGFHGPIMLEGSASGSNAIEATANARANREFLQKTLASL